MSTSTFPCPTAAVIDLGPKTPVTPMDIDPNRLFSGDEPSSLVDAARKLVRLCRGQDPKGFGSWVFDPACLEEICSGEEVASLIEAGYMLVEDDFCTVQADFINQAYRDAPAAWTTY